MEKDKNRISLTNKSNIATTTTLAIVATLLFLLFQLIQPFFLIFISAFILSVLLNPLFTYLNTKRNFSKTISALIAIVFFLIVALIPLGGTITLLIQEIRAIISQNNTALFRKELIEVIYGFLNQFGLSIDNFSSEINNFLINSLRFLSANLTKVLSSTLGLIVNIILTMLVTFNFLVHREKMIRYIFQLNPLGRIHLERLSNKASEIIVGTIRGNIIVVTIQAVLGGIGFFLFGVQSPILLGILYGLASMIPTIGIAFIWIPISASLIISGNVFGAIGIVVWSLTSNVVMDNFLSPKIIGSQTKMHPILMLFGILGGINVFGIIGIIVGPTIIALSLVALEIYRELLKD
ncbi:MAG: AI-2E family transporter [Candidatus Levybacteria bacterium]|nr:AI-2E family transporter [Candidatus Levybacteria bacterium]